MYPAKGVFIMKFNVYVINKTEYGKGKEVGTWLNLPMTCNGLDDTLAKIGVSTTNYNYIIRDTEVDIPFTYKINDDTSLAYLNSLANDLVEVKLKGDLEWIAAYMEATGYSLEATLDSYENHSYYDANSDTIEVY